ncbi:hypothetical protein [Alteromonas halophila]|uniref:Uncharacterized protein n=1 Tax=Alteromonas halophila TaxID=516698 RepID=A0A918MWI4_9ALTE|nr:hypothetical protein [Alteromonas halophila]GGW76405.1 hypothetical protein GCM10007391_06280 [Alteromonas halophila]
MEKQVWYRNPEMLVALSAIVTSVVAVVVSIYSAYVDRSYARASVWPSIMIAQSHLGSHLKYVVINQGTGPALIKYARIGTSSNYYPTWRALITDAGFANASYTQAHISSGVVRASQEIVAFETRNEDLITALDNVLVNAEICYCSIYEECWISTGGMVTRSVEACTLPPATERFKQ